MSKTNHPSRDRARRGASNTKIGRRHLAELRRRYPEIGDHVLQAWSETR
jgi:hypothetical protein